MKKLLFALCSLFAFQTETLEYEVQIENEHVNVLRVKIMPFEEIGLHRDVFPQVVVAVQGGTITRFEADGSTIDVHFPQGVAVYRDIDPPNVMHKSKNLGDEPVELIIIQLKSE